MRKLFTFISLLAAAPLFAQTVTTQSAPVRDNAQTAVLQTADQGMFRSTPANMPLKGGGLQDYIRYEQPAGVDHNRLLRNGFAFRNTQSGVQADTYEYAVGRYVEGDDGCIYIYEPFNTLSTLSWLKLDKVSDGYYVAHTPQPIYENNGQVYYASWYKMARLDESTYGWIPDTVNGQPDGDIYFTLENGVLAMEEEEHFEDTRYPAHMLCLTNGLGEWVGYSDGFTRMEPFNEKAAQLPDGVKPQVFSLETSKMNSVTQEISTVRQMTLAAAVGNDFYVQNPGDTTAWMKGEIKDGKVVFQPQYAGADELQCYHFWMKPASYSIVSETSEYSGVTFYNRSYEEQAEMSFAYDPTNMTLTSDEGTSMLLSVRPNEIFFLHNYDDPVYKRFVEQESTPIPPVLRDWWGIEENGGSGLVQFDLIPKGMQNESLNSNKLYYRLYLNDENTIYTFSPVVYEGLEKDMKEVPYSFSDGYYFFSNNDTKAFFYYFDEQQYERLGLQSVYYGGDVEHGSDIVWIKATDIVGIESAGVTENCESAEYFDLQGRRLSQPVKGGVTLVRQGGKVSKRIIR